MSFIKGMCRPSSNTSRASIARRRPPMSGMCEVVAENATSRPARKIGLRTLTSLICPVPIQAAALDEPFLTRGLEAVRGARLAAVDERELGGRAAHIEGEQIAAAARAA